MDEIKIAEWNVNFKIGTEVKIADFVQDYIKSEFDIIVFTEIVKTKSVINLMKKMGEYNFYESVYEEGKNQVIIAAKKELHITSVITQFPRSKDYSGIIPDFLQIEMLIENEKYCIIGTRIKIKKLSEDDYEKRMKQVEKLLEYIKKEVIEPNKKIVILGDFNNGMIRENKVYEGNCARIYNYHKIEDEFEKNGFKICPPKGYSSWGLQFHKGDFAYGYIKNDHMIISNNINIDDVNSQYDWRFVNEHKDIFKNMDREKQENSEYEQIIVTQGIPDHALLKATITLNKKTR